MRSIRPLLFSSLVLPLLVAAPLVACGGGGDGGTDGTVTPEGEHYKSVAKEVSVPSTAAQPKQFGLDLDGDAMVDNQLGTALVTLGAALGNPTVSKDAVDAAVAKGSIILLADFQTKDFTTSSAAGLSVKLGENPMPTPCTNPADVTTCGHHLDGTGSFTVSTSSPTNASLAGTIVGGTFTAGPGKVTLQIALGTAPIQLDLIGARVEASGISADGITTMKIAGAVLETDFDGKVLPGIKSAVIDPDLVAGNCNAAPPSCGCTSGSTGASIITLLDKSPPDCMISIDEIKNNPTLKPLITPDVALDANTGLALPAGTAKNALSIGVKAKTVKAAF